MEMGKEEKQEEIIIRKPLIIAMKGHPGTGKSTLANALASTLKFPLIDKDDIRDSTFHLQHSYSSQLLNDLSYEAIWRVASTQLKIGLSVIIDSPLSRKTHLDRLLNLAASGGARLLIVECQPLHEASGRKGLKGGEKVGINQLLGRSLRSWSKGIADARSMMLGMCPRWWLTRRRLMLGWGSWFPVCWTSLFLLVVHV
ncbi:hypothetical protein REPUB_Repub09cG0060400 [Reevesia pubescens]